jgi:hypothetical protein
MMITFENDNDLIVNALEKVIAHARRTQQIIIAHCVWWLASIIGLEQGLTIYIDNIRKRGTTSQEFPVEIPEERAEEEILRPAIFPVQPSRSHQVPKAREVSSTPRDLTEDLRLDRILKSAERVIQDSFRDRTVRQQGRVNPQPTTKLQLKEARKVKRLQEARERKEAERNERLQEIRATVIQHLSKE